jgi:hypothetical protein
MGDSIFLLGGLDLLKVQVGEGIVLHRGRNITWLDQMGIRPSIT